MNGDRLYWATDLFKAPPEGFSKSLTISGLVNGGAKRYPFEWEKVLEDPRAAYSVAWYVVADKHNRDEIEHQRIQDIAKFLAGPVSEGKK